MSNIIETKNLSKSYFINKKLDILKNINIKIKKGDLVALLGPSGSGKSTFLHLIALLDDPSVGEIYFDSNKITKLPDVEKYLPTESGDPPLGRAEYWAWDEKEKKIVPKNKIDNKSIFPMELVSLIIRFINS